MVKKTHHKRGGARPNSGRPRKDTDIWGQITCVLRKDTIQKLKEGSGGKMKHFGQFLQFVLDRRPLPDRETYLHWRQMQKLDAKPVEPGKLHARLAWERHLRQMRAEAKRKEQEAQEWAQATPRQRAMIRTLQKLAREDAKKLAAQ